jgi:hypothetical protein
VKAKIDFELKPFTVPNFAITERDPRLEIEETSLPLKALDSDTLDRLCNDFRAAVFKKAGKPQPPTQG